MDVISRFDDKGPAWYWNMLHLGEHTGTHFDAPVHWITGKDLPDNALRHDSRAAVRRPGVRDRRDERGREERGLSPDAGARRRRGRRSTGAFRRTPGCCCAPAGASATDPKSFLNVRADGPHSPGFHKSTSELLAQDRDVLGVGVETVGTDAGQAGTFDPPFPNHATMHGAGKFGLASLRNLDQLPATGAIVIAAPLKIVNGSGSPLRVIAIAPA